MNDQELYASHLQGTKTFTQYVPDQTFSNILDVCDDIFLLNHFLVVWSNTSTNHSKPFISEGNQDQVRLMVTVFGSSTTNILIDHDDEETVIFFSQIKPYCGLKAFNLYPQFFKFNV